MAPQEPPPRPERPEPGESARFCPPADSSLSQRLWRFRSAGIAVLTVVSILVIPARYGFDLSPGLHGAVSWTEAVLSLLFCFDLVARLVSSEDRKGFLREHRGEAAILAVFLLTLGLFLLEMGSVKGAKSAALVAVELYLVLNVVLRLVTLEQFLLSKRIKPIQIFVLSFASIILLGALSLTLLPNATASPGGIGFVDALFTATSATCVTGLVVVDTGTFFTPFGQAIILILVQLGGLGIMTFAAFCAVALGKKMSMGESFVIKSALNVEVVGTIRRLLVTIFLVTFLMEGLGAGLLYASGAGRLHPAGNLWFSIFHSVSAFCNAGFCLNPDSLTSYCSFAGFNLVVMLLILLGGLGFVVLTDVFNNRLLPLVHRKENHLGRRLSAHTRLVLWTTAVLLLLGFVTTLAVEWNGALEGKNLGEKILASLFQSVTARTAGFNTLDTGALANPTLLCVIVLMFIGASPGSTGGGIKTTTFSVLLFSVWSVFKGRAGVEIFKRRIPREIVSKALVIIFSALIFLSLAIFFLSATEPLQPLRDVAFEAVSAFGTVGLSTGITSSLSTAGKLILTIVMFAGRLGPLTLVLALAIRERQTLYSYPEESVMIG